MSTKFYTASKTKHAAKWRVTPTASAGMMSESESTMTTHDLQDRLSDLEAELEAYKRAKAENDERYMIERDQARLELQSLKAQVADREKLTNEVTDTAETLTEELQSLKAQNAAMRSALEKAAHELNVIRARDGVPWTHYGKSDVCPNYFSSVVDECQAALSTTQPSSPRSLGATYHGPYVSREAVLPLVDCLKHIENVALNCRENASMVLSAVGLSAIAGLAKARELGLLEDKP